MSDFHACAAVREDFPASSRMLYLDTAHQSPLAGSVRQALEAFYQEASACGGPKPVWLERVERVRARVAAFLGAQAGELAFTKNTSEGLNIAANAIDFKPGDNVLLIEGDHPNNAYAWLNLKRRGVEVRFVKLDRGVADAALFAPRVDARTRAISLSHVTFHAGHRHDVADVGRLCRERGIYLVVDAMQSVGVLPVDVKAMGVSMLAAGCHKGLLVPQGLGLLYVDAALTELRPVYLATAGLARPPADLIADPDDLALREDAGRFEIGNYNLADIHALDAALDLIAGVGIANIERHVLALGDRLIERMDALGVGLAGPRERARRAHIYVLDLPAERWAGYLAQQGVRVSPERDGVRVSFGVFNTPDDVDRVAGIIAAGLQAPASA
ncbi:aminotransferase class V-fold PLP-dependent enzyme [Achromobacter veterisilvae]|uniref:Aminotransferase class V-fold PLP-dependent enzyme n=1 Tax=Achromobacter veterisilvae TaxID=2069367 RepID=A0ABZ2RRK5_9BURK